MTLLLNSLPDATRGLFLFFSKNKFFSNYTLVGGSALALQIGHRQSVDLDFIYDSEKLNDHSIKRFILREFPDYQPSHRGIPSEIIMTFILFASI